MPPLLTVPLLPRLAALAIYSPSLLPCVTAVPPYRRSYSAAPAVPFVPPSGALPAVCCRRAALPPTLAAAVPPLPQCRAASHTHTPYLLLDRVCDEK